MKLKSTCKPRKGLGLFASLFASQLSFQLSTLSSLAKRCSLLAAQPEQGCAGQHGQCWPAQRCSLLAAQPEQGCAEQHGQCWPAY